MQDKKRMTEHGDHDPQQQKWYCGYWMTQDEWLDIHDYSPATIDQDTAQPADEEE